MAQKRTPVIIMGASSASDRVFAIPELIDHIFCFLRSDLPTLKACSLVNTTWDVFASPFIFVKIAFRAAAKTIQASAHGDTFEESYVRNGPRVRDHARDLLIAYTSGAYFHLHAKLRLDQIVDVVADFPHLHTVRIDTQCVFTLPDPAPSLPLALALDTLALDVYSHTFHVLSPTALFDVFASIDTLQLTFHGYFLPSTSIFTDSAAALSHAVRRTRSLVVCGFQDAYRIPASEIVAASLDHTTLRCLTLDDFALGTAIAPVNLFLRQHFKHISTFRLVIRNHNDIAMGRLTIYPPEDTRVDFDLSACPELRTIQIAFWFNCTSSFVVQQRREALWSLSVTALSRAPAGALTDVCFELRLLSNHSLLVKGRSTASQCIGALRDLQWDLLEDVLDRQPHLSIEVRLVHDGPRLTTSQVALIEARLPPRLVRAITFSSA